MSYSSVPKKRKRKVASCPNPLFVKWLTEWRDEAASQGKKTQYAFGKALQAIKKYPMPLRSGKEAKILDHFGDKICNMLDHKLAKHIKENGEDSLWPVDNDDPSPSSSSHGSTIGQIDCSLTIPPPPDIDNIGQIPRKRRPSNRAPREYVPVYRSGPYALILTLYREYRKPTNKGFMLKTELQREAAPLSEKSFTIPDPECHYTAWSSMSTLINKGYVIKEGSPARYSITEAGCQLASKLETVDAAFGQNTSDSSCSVDRPTVNNKPATSRKRKDVKRPETAAPLCNATPLAAHGATHQPPHSDRLEYWYIDDHGNQVSMKDEAAVTVDDDISIGFRIKADEAVLKRSGVRYKRDYMTPAEGSMIYGYLHNDDASEYCPIPSAYCSQAKTTSRSNCPATADPLPSLPSLPSSKNIVPAPSKPRHKKSVPPATNRRTDSQHSTLSSCSTTSEYSTIKSSDSQLSHSSFNSFPSSSTSVQHHNSSQNSWKSMEPSSMNSQSSTCSVASFNSGKPDFLQGASSQDTEASSKEPPVPMYVLAPGTFDVVLCVDSCETAGGAANSRKQLLLPELQKNGVALDVRKLQVGDFLWIAREKRVPVPGMLQMPVARELVLDYVVERKRMDDLCGSIMDGRFKEQKFRLKQSGLRKPIYLIEDFGSIDHMSIPASTLRQAVTNTQVIDGFFVKHSKDNKESAAYLTIMTRYLQGHYSNKTLEAYHRDDLGNLHSNRSLTSPVQKLITFTELNTSSIKNKNTTITETFAKQLLQFSGLTAEKALAITKQYPTPSDLMDVYNGCSVKDREKLLSRIKYGKLQRNLGPMLSKMIHMFYCTDGPLT